MDGADTYVPFEGGNSERRGGTATFLSVPESVQYWVRWNQCNTEPVTETLYSNTVHQTTWTGCADQADVVLYAIENWKHYWPGPYDTASLDADYPMKSFNAAEIIWRFFQEHTR